MSRRQVEKVFTGRFYLMVTFVILLFLVSLCCALIPSALITIILFTVLGLSTIIILHPHFAPLLLFACAGLPAFVLQLPGHNMHLVEPATFLCLLVVLIYRPASKFYLPHLLALLFLTIATLSFIHVPEFSSSTNIYAPDKRLLALYIVFAALFCGTFFAPYIKDTSSFLIKAVLVNIPLYLIALAQTYGVSLSPLLEASDANNIKLTQGRLWGPFPWSVNFGMYLINLFAISIACWLAEKRPRNRTIGCIVSIVTALAIAGSGTRSVAIAAALITLLAFLITRRFKTLFWTLLLAIPMLTPFFPKILPLFVHDETSTGNRLLIWNTAIKLILNNPLIGIGLQQFHYYYAQLIVDRATELGPQGIHPHQQYLEWAMESGIFWLIVGVLLLASILFTCGRTYYVAEHKQRSILLATILAVLANSIICFFDAPLDQLEGPVFLFLLTGLALGTVGQIYAGRTKTRTKHLPQCLFSALPSKKQMAHIFSETQTSLASPLAKTGPPITSLSKTASQSVTHRTRWAIVLPLLSWALPIPIIFPMTALLARYLGPIQYGEYSLTLPFLTLFSFLSGTGMDQLLVRQLSNQPRNTWGQTLSYAAGSRFLSTFLSVFLAAIVAWIMPVSGEQRTLFLIGSFSLFFSFSVNGVRIIYSHGFRAEQKVLILSLLEAINRILTAGLVALIVLLHLSLFWAYILLIYSDLPACILQILIASRRFKIQVRFNLRTFCTHMLEGIPLVLHHILTLLAGQLDFLLLLFITGPLNAGIYALASRIIDPLGSIATAYGNGLYPLFCTIFKTRRTQFAQTCYEALRILALLSIPFAVLVSTAANTIVSILSDQRFASAATAVQFLIWAMIITFFKHIYEQACLAANMERSLPFITLFSLCTNLLFNLLFIPRWQIAGAGLAALFSECLSFIALIALLRKHVYISSLLHIVFRILLSNLPALFILLYLHNSYFLLMIPLALLSTTVCYLLTRTLSITDIKHLLGKLTDRQRKGDEPHNTTTDDLEPPGIAEYPTLILPQVRV